MRGGRGRWLVAAAGGCAIVAACSIYDSSLLLTAPTEAGAPVVEAGAPPDAGAAGDADTCAHTHAPAAPTTEDGNEALDVVFAGTNLRLARSGAGTTPPPAHGFDLDGLCTCPAAEACKPLDTLKHCDADGGADDALGGLFETFSALAPGVFGDTALSAGVQAGNRNILFRLRSWNGGKNDTQVTFIVYASTGLAAHQQPDGGDVVPANDGSDVWLIDPSSLLGGTAVDGGATCEGNDNVCVPLYADTTAYVSNGVLVARLDFPLAFGTGDSTLVIRLQSSVVRATLIRQANGTVRVDDGEVIGRWATSALLTTLGSVPDPIVMGGHLCGDAGSYPNVKKMICAAADLAADPSKDGTGAACGALSSAIAFSAVPARIGGILALTPDVSACGAGYSDDCGK